LERELENLFAVEGEDPEEEEDYDDVRMQTEG